MPCPTSFPIRNAQYLCSDLLLQASESGDGFSNSLTWAAVIALVGILIGSCLTIVHRRRDKEAKRLRPDYELLDDTVVLLDKLATIPATKVDLAELGEQCSRIKQAERRSPTIPFGTVVAYIEAYEKTTLPNDFAKRLLKNKDFLDECLKLSRQQGAAIEAALAAIASAQRTIERRTRR
jgi:hypothetical protein